MALPLAAEDDPAIRAERQRVTDGYSSQDARRLSGSAIARAGLIYTGMARIIADAMPQRSR